MSISITANELKTRGIKYVEELAEQQEETPITVHGREKYVILTMRKYEFLRELELSNAVAEARAEYRSGDYKRGPVDEHLMRLGHGEK